MKIAIVDDELCFRTHIETLIKKESPSSKVFLFDSGKSLFSTDIYEYSMIFLDIEMKDIDGISIALQIKKQKAKAIIFFVTSHSNYITSALKSMPFQYLMKPINEKVFGEEFKRALKLLIKMKNEIQTTWNGEKKFVIIDSIIYIEYSARKLHFYCKENKLIESKGKIRDYFLKLEEYDFVQTHNSFLVNLAMVAKIMDRNIVMKNGTIVPISKKYLNTTKEALRIFISGVVI